MSAIDRPLKAIDSFQQRRRWLAFPFAVVKKFGDDRAGNLAALIAYYGFFSLFPLLLVFVTVLGYVLRGHPHLLASIQSSTLANFPVVGSEIKVGTISGSGIALIVGILVTLWAGLGVTQAAQNAMNEVWDVPMKDRPNFFLSKARGLMVLALLGTITVATIFLAGLGSASGDYAAVLRVLGFAGSLALNVLLFALSYRILTRQDLSWGDVMPGAIVAAVLWTALQVVGGYYVTRQVSGASTVYGTFAVVLGLLAWIYLGAQITLYCAEINVVRVRHLWPRSLVQPLLTGPDHESLEQQAKEEQRRPEEDVAVTWREGDRAAG